MINIEKGYYLLRSKWLTSDGEMHIDYETVYITSLKELTERIKASADHLRAIGATDPQITYKIESIAV
jgi:hypothetical protein